MVSNWPDWGSRRASPSGRAYVVESGALEVPVHEIGKDQVAAEIDRFHEAVARGRDQLAVLSQKARTLHGSAAEELEYLLVAHSRMLEGSRLVRGVEERVRDQRLNAEAAVSQEVGDIVRAFSDMNDSYLAERSKDVRDVGKRLLHNLMAAPTAPSPTLPRARLSWPTNSRLPTPHSSIRAVLRDS